MADAQRPKEARCVLIADDEADIRLPIVFMLRNRGFEILEAASGELAWEMMRTKQPHIALLDVAMPRLNGIEVAMLAAGDALTAHIPVVFLSALHDREDIEAGLRAGARAYLAKPFSPSRVANVIEEILAAA